MKQIVCVLCMSWALPMRPVMARQSVTENKQVSPSDTKKSLASAKRLPGSAPGVEDCLACRFIWMQVEASVGSEKTQEGIYNAFLGNCLEAEKSPVFSPACQAMENDVYGMTSQYMDGHSVEQLCMENGFCRAGQFQSKAPKRTPAHHAHAKKKQTRGKSGHARLPVEIAVLREPRLAVVPRRYHRIRTSLHGCTAKPSTVME